MVFLIKYNFFFNLAKCFYTELLPFMELKGLFMPCTLDILSVLSEFQVFKLSMLITRTGFISMSLINHLCFLLFNTEVLGTLISYPLSCVKFKYLQMISDIYAHFNSNFTQIDPYRTSSVCHNNNSVLSSFMTFHRFVRRLS